MLCLEYHALVIEHVSREPIEFLHKWLVGIQIEVIILPQYPYRFFTHQSHISLLQFYVQVWGTWINVIHHGPLGLIQ